MKSNKIRKSAKGRDCQVRLDFICNFDPATTVLAHVGKGGGMGAKALDIHATFACSACHDEMDGRTRTMDRTLVELYSWHGVQRTQTILVNEGLINYD